MPLNVSLVIHCSEQLEGRGGAIARLTDDLLSVEAAYHDKTRIMSDVCQLPPTTLQCLQPLNHGSQPLGFKLIPCSFPLHPVLAQFYVWWKSLKLGERKERIFCFGSANFNINNCDPMKTRA
jgi:hypothetical protein